MSTRTWHKGPPPFPGWWNASWDFNNCLWRWWNGREWSLPAFDWDTAANVKFVAAESDPNQKLIEWTDYWPENARVPRVDPRSKT